MPPLPTGKKMEQFLAQDPAKFGTRSKPQRGNRIDRHETQRVRKGLSEHFGKKADDNVALEQQSSRSKVIKIKKSSPQQAKPANFGTASTTTITPHLLAPSIRKPRKQKTPPLTKAPKAPKAPMRVQKAQNSAAKKAPMRVPKAQNSEAKKAPKQEREKTAPSNTKAIKPVQTAPSSKKRIQPVQTAPAKSKRIQAVLTTPLKSQRIGGAEGTSKDLVSKRLGKKKY